MNALEEALGAITSFLEERQIAYMVIGGIANLIWGVPRATLDVDVTVLVEESRWPDLIHDLNASFHVLPKRPRAFLQETHVLPIETAAGVRIDLLWAQLPYEYQAIARAHLEEIAGRRVRVCRPEDLVIHKIISERPKDREDVQAIIRVQGPRLDQAYLISAVRDLAKALTQPELLTFLKACLRKTPIRRPKR